MNGYTPICYAKTIAIANADNILTKDRLEREFHAPAIFHFRKNGRTRWACSLSCQNKF